MPIIRGLDAREAQARIGELAAILVDVVEGGASVNFMAGFSLPEAEAFWRGQLPGLADGKAMLFVAEDGAEENAPRLIGTVLLFFAQQPNQPFRGEIGKMLVLRSHRGLGLGRRLLTRAEEAARQAGRTLLVLDTEAGSAGDRLYRACGWTPFGTCPGYAYAPDGTPADATFFYKSIA